MAIAYTGPDPKYIRTIVKVDDAWPDDDDWLGDFTTAEPDAQCWSVPAVRRGSSHPIKNMAIYFAAVDDEGVQVAATATLRGFIINKPELYGLGPDKPGIRHPSTVVKTAYDLTEPFVITATKYYKMGVRVSAIASDAAEIRISVQEMR